MKVSYISSVLPVVFFAAFRVSAYPIRGSLSAVAARELALLDEVSLDLRSEEELYERGNVLDKMHIGNPAELTEAQKKAEVAKLQAKQSSEVKAHHAAVAKVEKQAGGPGLQVHPKGPMTPHEQKVGTEHTQKGWDKNSSLKIFKHADVHVESHEGGVKHITSKYHNADGGPSATVHYRHQDPKKPPKESPSPSNNPIKKAAGKIAALKPEPKPISEKEKNAKIAGLDKKLHDNFEKNAHKVAQIENNPSGKLKVQYHGPEQDKHLAEKLVRNGHKANDELKQYSHVDVKSVAAARPGTKHFAATYHNGDPTKIGQTATVHHMHS